MYSLMSSGLPQQQFQQQIQTQNMNMGSPFIQPGSIMPSQNQAVYMNQQNSFNGLYRKNTIVNKSKHILFLALSMQSMQQQNTNPQMNIPINEPTNQYQSLQQQQQWQPVPSQQQPMLNNQQQILNSQQMQQAFQIQQHPSQVQTNQMFNQQQINQTQQFVQAPFKPQNEDVQLISFD